jgi:phosphinothricin tripeptide acetyl hydrolase
MEHELELPGGDLGPPQVLTQSEAVDRRECMLREGIKAIRQVLTGMPDMANMSIDEQRAYMDESGRGFLLPPGAAVKREMADGVPAEWVKMPGASEDAAILYLHGGGYAIGSPTSHRHLAAAISGAAGAPVLSLAYRLAPEHPFPAAVEDAAMGYQWLLKKGFLPARVGIAGDSAGGGLTVAALLALRDVGVPLPAVGICISPWVDLTCSAESYRTKASVDPLVNQDGIVQFVRWYLGDQDPRTPLASPLFADLIGLPPLLIQVGSDEVLLDDAVGLDAKARAAGVQSTLEIWEEMIHVWHFFAPMLKEGRDAVVRIGEFFKSHVG